MACLVLCGQIELEADREGGMKDGRAGPSLIPLFTTCPLHKALPETPCTLITHSLEPPRLSLAKASRGLWSTRLYLRRQSVHCSPKAPSASVREK